MSELTELAAIVRHQVLMELPQICDAGERERAIDETINSWSNVELLERMSIALETKI